MNDFKELKLGDEERDYVRECLADGKTLCHYLLQYCDLGSDDVVTHLPQDITIEEAKRFSTGGKLPVPQEYLQYRYVNMVPIPNTNEHLGGVIQNLLKMDQSICLVEDYSIHPTDPILRLMMSV